MEKETKESLVKIVLSAVLLAGAMLAEKITDLETWQLLLVYLIPYLAAGWETLKEAGEKLFEGKALDEDFLMSIATIGALCIGFLPGAESQFPEAVFVMLFFQLGEMFEHMAEGKSRRSISGLMDIRPDTANVERDGAILTVPPTEVTVGETVVVRPGEKVPMDGVVVEGTSSLNTVALTGESVPRDVTAGEEIYSGCVNLSGVLRVKVSKIFQESTASRILNLVENASESKSRREYIFTRFSLVYTPAVVACAVLLAIIPPALSGSFGSAFPTWFYRALMFLVVSCPCALVISVPLAFFGGIGGASRKGILVKGSNYLEAMAKMGTIVFDKTGTLTEGVFEVAAVHPERMSESELLSLAAKVEKYSTHPIADSIREASASESDGSTIEDVEEIAGHGVRATVDGKRVCVGNSRLMASEGTVCKDCSIPGTILHVSVDGEYEGHIVISDKIKSDAAKAISDIKAAGVSRTVMLTGDRKDVAEYVASQTGVDEFKASLLPAEKVSEVEKLIGVKEKGRTLAFVGDGINDAPVLARADVGIAMGALGSDAAIEAADVVLMDDKPSKIAAGIRIARKTRRIAGENTCFAIFIKILVLVLAAAGIAAMWMAVFADVGVTVLAILNSMRTLKTD